VTFGIAAQLGMRSGLIYPLTTEERCQGMPGTYVEAVENVGAVMAESAEDIQRGNVEDALGVADEVRAMIEEARRLRSEREPRI
jgi:hypothetical protein